MTGGGPAEATVTLSYFIYLVGFEEGRLGYTSAAAWLLFLMVFSATLLNWKFGSQYVFFSRFGPGAMIPSSFFLTPCSDETAVDRFAALAKEHNMIIIIPIYEIAIEGVYYNSAAIVDGDGKLLVTNFDAGYITAFDHSVDAIRIETQSPGAVFDHLTAYDSGTVTSHNGIYISGLIGGLSDSLAYDNTGYGIYLTGTGNAAVEANEAYGNRYGLYVNNTVSSTITVIGNEDLALGRGNLVHDNSDTGIFSGGSNVLIAGNTVSGHTGTLRAGIHMSGGRTWGNVVYGNYYGINGTGDIQQNRVYDNIGIGIRTSGTGGEITGNAVYSNPVGIDVSYYYSSGAQLINNLVYGNGVSGLVLNGGNGHTVINNSFYAPTGDAISLQGSTQNVELRNNIVQVDDGYGVNVAANSQGGFTSDYNLFYTSGTGALSDLSGFELTHPRLFGRHNRENALAALVAAHALGLVTPATRGALLLPAIRSSATTGTRRHPRCWRR